MCQQTVYFRDLEVSRILAVAKRMTDSKERFIDGYKCTCKSLLTCPKHETFTVKRVINNLFVLLL